MGLIPGSGRSPGGEHGNLFQYSCLENSLDRGAWKAIVHGVAKSQTRLSDFTFTFPLMVVELHSPANQKGRSNGRTMRVDKKLEKDK